MRDTRLRARAAPMPAAGQAHPLVRGIDDGTLDVEHFGYYVAQDYVILLEFVRVLALAAAKSNDLATMEQFTELQHATLTTEMALHRDHCERFGISAAALEATRPSPATQAYTRHLLRVAYGGTVAEIEAALLPCRWGGLRRDWRGARCGGRARAGAALRRVDPDVRLAGAPGARGGHV